MTPELSFPLWQSPLLAISSIAVAVAVAITLGLLFRYESRLVPLRVGLSLMGLRFLVLLVLLIVVFQPTWVWTTRQERHGRVWIAVDTSQSMSVADDQAEPEEKAVWAEGIGRITAAERKRLSEPDDDAPADADDEAEGDGDIEAAAAEANLRQSLEDVSELTRLQIAARLLTDSPAQVLDRLEQQYDVELVAFDQEARRVDAAALEEWLRADEETAFGGAVTNLEQGLTPNDLGNDGEPLLGVILFTDGRDNSQGDPLRAAATLRQSEVPVYIVPLGTRRPARDLAVLNLDAPPTVLSEDIAKITATIGTHGFEGENIEIELSAVGDSELLPEPIVRTRQASGSSLKVSFDLPAKAAGRHELKVSVRGSGEESRDDNNERQFAISVADDRIGVLLVDGPPRWEFRYLQSMFERDPRVRLVPVLFEAPSLGLLDEGFVRSNWPFHDSEQEPLPDIDLVVFGDVPPEFVNDEVWERLHQFVSEQGGTIVFQPGANSFPERYRSEWLDKLLPVRDVQAYTAPGRRLPGRGGFGLRLSVDGMQEAVLQLGREGEDAVSVWSNLPGHQQLWIGPARPGASVWVEAVDTTEAPSLDQSRRNGVLVHTHYGMGQVLWMGLADTWRWRFRAGDRLHHQFWGQLSRWAADTKALAAHGFVRFGPERNDVPAGSDVGVTAHFSQPFLEQYPQPEADVLISAIEPDGQITPRGSVPLEPADADAGTFRAVLRDLPPGEYRLRLQMTDEDLRDRVVESVLYVREPLSAELSDLTNNLPLLNDIATASGGRVFAANQMEELLSMFGEWDDLRIDTERRSAWDNWLTLSLVFVLLTAEWVIRKLNGLP